jgi:hypothetical protein
VVLVLLISSGSQLGCDMIVLLIASETELVCHFLLLQTVLELKLLTITEFAIYPLISSERSCFYLNRQYGSKNDLK